MCEKMRDLFWLPQRTTLSDCYGVCFLGEIVGTLIDFEHHQLRNARDGWTFWQA
jgi:hypothetical protein